ncbi:MAG: hypothetical protein CMA25_07820 [Euryarchaeota archaeon]|nr:hypothetical protein [Euryarchaeota archaeon]|tara:strand:- start:62 stop:442 length:381 start_codon:yes stop_codon:yes gene_type:complete
MESEQGGMDEEEIDPFAELEVSTQAPQKKGENMLEALMNEEDEIVPTQGNLFGETVVEFEDVELEIESDDTDSLSDAEQTYSMLLETVWVDDILDPSEVELLARKRDELNISFEKHLMMVRKIIGV